MASSFKISQLAILTVILLLYIEFVRGQEELVQCYDGYLNGTTLTAKNGGKILAFLGIPYAKPPVGSLRFRHPVASEPWDGIFQAVAEGDQCPQLDNNGKVVGSEDCLKMNIYTPEILTVERTKPLFPTMVYIHGGNFVSGNGSTINFGPEYFLQRDIVLVTINYRLGILGFLSTGDGESPGNFGLKDQVLALKWIQKNIPFFGGDPNRVTLYGQDAGGASVNLHAITAASRGLFNRIIAQSGSARCFWAWTDNGKSTQYANKLGKYLDCPTTNSKVLVDCLREMDTHRLLNTDDIFDDTYYIFRTWTPTNEPKLPGAFITEHPYTEVSYQKVRGNLGGQMIFGNVADEGLLFTAQLYSNDDMYEKIVSDIKAFVHFATSMFLDEDARDDYVSEATFFYFNQTNFNDKENVIKNITNLLSDVAFLSNAIHMARLTMIELKSVVYWYSFEYRGTFSRTSMTIGSNENIGVTHGDDLIYLFSTSPEQFDQPQLKFSEADELMIETMMDLWTSFAYNGVPYTKRFNDSNLWQPYTYETEDYLEIGKNSDTSLRRGYDFNTIRSQFWDRQAGKQIFNGFNIGSHN